MLYGLIVIDKSGFPIFEHFTNPNKRSQTSTSLIDMIQENNNAGRHRFEDLIIFVKEINEKFNVGVIYGTKNDPVELSGRRLTEIGEDILRGDKFTIQRVFNAASLSDLL